MNKEVLIQQQRTCGVPQLVALLWAQGLCLHCFLLSLPQGLGARS